jgi:hypothetical protein
VGEEKTGGRKRALWEEGRDQLRIRRYPSLDSEKPSEAFLKIVGVRLGAFEWRKVQ